jgi:DMSO/TMAO reductase YedYZ molybdopterin-dependent catalytic subunit
MKFRRRKHSRKLSTPSTLLLRWGSWVSTAPENRETPLANVQSWVTPNPWFFVRSHFQNPDVDLESWRLNISGSVERELNLSRDQINSLPQRSVFSTIECAGNGRSFLKEPVEGVQWTAGAVGHAEWSGVPLKYVIEEAGLKPETVEIVFEGADRGIEKGDTNPIPFARSLPVEKALHPDTLLAVRMNGQTLEPSHGFPVRLLVPGWYGVASVKWLTRIEAVTTRFQGYFQNVKYTIQRPTGRGVQTESVGPMPVKSEVIRPADDAVLGVGTNRVFGMAWAGESAISSVEVSVDGGEYWQRAELNGPRAPYSWTLWEFLWRVDAPGEYSILSRAISESGHIQPIEHDRNRGGYLITFSRPTRITIDADLESQDLLGDTKALESEFAALARERSELTLDADLDLTEGAGI